jgi:hypothetical protein
MASWMASRVVYRCHLMLHHPYPQHLLESSVLALVPASREVLEKPMALKLSDCVLFGLIGLLGDIID